MAQRAGAPRRRPYDRRLMANLINVERATVGYGTRTLLDGVSLGVDEGDAIGVVGRNGDGKTTLLQVLTATRAPDSGRVTHTSGLSVGYLLQSDDFAVDATIRDVIVGGRADHIWAADADTRAVVENLLSEIDLDNAVADLSGGERRRVALAAVLLAGHDVLVLDEPTNHLDVEVIGWLAGHLAASAPRGRWWWSATTAGSSTRSAPAPGRCTTAKSTPTRADTRPTCWRAPNGCDWRRAPRPAGSNLMRKELAWLRRGPPARTSKPKFRIQAANDLIANEPEPRDSLALQRFATARLGKDVFDLHRVVLELGGKLLLDQLDWSIGPGARIGLVGVNGTGKTSVLKLLGRGARSRPSGTVKRGSDAEDRLSEPGACRTRRQRTGARRRREPPRITELAGGKEVSTATLLEDFGFTGDKLTTRLADLSGGERRRFQFLRLLLDEPNVLLLDEPTNDLDIDTLNVLEDYLDGWPGTLLVGDSRPLLPRARRRRHLRTGRRRSLRHAARRHRAVPRRAGGGRGRRRRPAPPNAQSPRPRGSAARERSCPASRVSSASSTSGSRSCIS